VIYSKRSQYGHGSAAGDRVEQAGRLSVLLIFLTGAPGRRSIPFRIGFLLHSLPSAPHGAELIFCSIDRTRGNTVLFDCVVPIQFMLAVEDFLRLAKIRPNTKDIYRRYLGYFVIWLNEQAIDESTVTPIVVHEFLDCHPEWSNSTKWNTLHAIKSYYTMMHGKSHEVAGTGMVREDPGPQRTLSMQKLEKLFASIDTSKAKGIRDLAIMTFFLDTGLRSSELCGLELRYLYMDQKRFHVRQKGGVWHEGCFFEYTWSCLSSWLAIRDQFALSKTKTVFVGTRTADAGNPLTRDGLRAMFRAYGKKAGIGLVSPHDMRRTFATESIRNGAPTRLVQVQGGWSSVSMVERYSRTLEAEALQPYSPVNRLMGFVTE